ncbi:MAG TPA: DNA-directed RNA polymerase subunit omega [Bacteroidetes bacterium]|nr:DNA-directed RNA polymerase subunit omega [Bacteroidota bacterium]
MRLLSHHHSKGAKPVAVKPVDIEDFSSAAQDVYEAIVIASKRARQIHQDIKIELNQRIETLNQLSNTPETEEETDVAANPDQLKISLEFEKRAKPTDLSTNEVLAKKVKWRYKIVEQPEVKAEEPEPEE